MLPAFNSIPINLRTPGSYLEIDASRAIRGLAVQSQRVLIIGQKIAAGTATANVPVRVSTVSQAIALFGRGSMLARQFAAFKMVDQTLDTWALPLDDLGGGVVATSTLTFTGAVTAAGVLYAYIGGQRLAVAVAAGQSMTSIAAALVTAVTNAPDLQVTAANVAGVVTLTAKNKGLEGNGIDVRLNYYQGEALPAGLACAIVAMANGAGNPDIAAVFTAIGDAQYAAFILPYTDAPNLTVMETELASRWGPLRMIEGMAYSAARGSQGTLSTLGSGRNSPYVSIIGANSSPSPAIEWGAAYGAAVIFSGQIDPARPFQGIPLPGLLPPAEVARFTRVERDLMLNDGISTFTVDASGVVLLERPITTYQLNAQALDDIAFLDVNTPLTLAFLRSTARARISSKFPRCKLAGDDAAFDGNQSIVRPKDIRAELVALFKDWQTLALVEDIEQFKRELVVERDPTDPNRVNAVIPPNIVNQFRVFAAQLQYVL